MSFEEKGTWLYLVIIVTLPIVYLATIAGQVASVPVDEIDYQGPLLAAIGAAIGLAILGMIAIAISSPAEADKSDQRDKDINRLGEYVGGLVLGFGMIVPFGLAMTEAPYFWIANVMYVVFVIAGLCGTVAKLVLYRRGF
jgi:drug/metabolite transporter (DMT)-like permease